MKFFSACGQYMDGTVDTPIHQRSLFYSETIKSALLSNSWLGPLIYKRNLVEEVSKIFKTAAIAQNFFEL